MIISSLKSSHHHSKESLLEEMNIGEDEWEDELFDGTVACVFATAEKKLAERNINNNNRKRDYTDAILKTTIKKCTTDEGKDGREGDALQLRASSSPLYKTKRAMHFASQPTSQTKTTTTTLKETLEKYYGYSNFRPGQEEVIKAAMEGSDTCVFWSTGSGKSLAYQLPALHEGGKMSIVVSPLISLMQDQVTALNNTVGNIADGSGGNNDIACFLGSGQTDTTVEERVFRGDYKIVFVTPEKISFVSDDGGFGSSSSSSVFMQRLQSLKAMNKIGLIAIDEAHCISQWGHDFRVSYKKLAVLRDQLPGIPIMALTATAVKHVR